MFYAVDMKQIGITADARPVMTDVFVLVGTHGLPLEMVLELMKERDWLVAWPDYTRDAMKDGAKYRTVRARVMAAVAEVCGQDYFVPFSVRWNEWFGVNA